MKTAFPSFVQNWDVNGGGASKIGITNFLSQSGFDGMAPAVLPQSRKWRDRPSLRRHSFKRTITPENRYPVIGW